MNSLARNDSSPMLRATDLRTLQTAIFGRSSPDHTPRLSARAKIVWLKRDPSYQPPLDCAPCYERECKFEHAQG